MMAQRRARLWRVARVGLLLPGWLLILVGEVVTTVALVGLILTGGVQVTWEIGRKRP
jgi:hypothetical protein